MQVGTRQMMSDMNLAPLIDIVLVVLIIMMVNIPIQIEEMGVSLPSNVEVRPQPRDRENTPDQLVIAIYEDGSVALNRMGFNEERLFAEVTRRLRPMERKNVFIDAYPTVTYGRVVQMMDVARAAGADRVALARMKEEGPLEPTGFDEGAAPRGVSVGNFTLRGGTIRSSDADRVITEALPTIQGCYFQQLNTDRTLTGRIMGQVAVQRDGTVYHRQVGQDTLGSPEVTTCVLQVLESLQFPPLVGEGDSGHVQYPLIFSPG